MWLDRLFRTIPPPAGGAVNPDERDAREDRTDAVDLEEDTVVSVVVPLERVQEEEDVGDPSTMSTTLQSE